MRRVALFIFISFVALRTYSQTDWPTYGHDPGGLRYSPLKQIDATNVAKLKVAWIYRMKPSEASATLKPPPSAEPDGQAARPLDGRQEIAAQDGASLPQGKGRNTTQVLCSVCHSTDVFVPMRHTRQEWSSIVENMVSKGLEAPDDELDEIKDYLAVSFPRPEEPSRAVTAQSEIPPRRAGHRRFGPRGSRLRPSCSDRRLRGHARNVLSICSVVRRPGQSVDHGERSVELRHARKWPPVSSRSGVLAGGWDSSTGNTLRHA